MNTKIKEGKQVVDALFLKNDGAIMSKKSGFLEAYLSWDIEARRYFEFEYLKKYFPKNDIIVILWNAAHRSSLDQITLTPGQSALLEETSEVLQDLIQVERDQTLQVRWLRMFLLRPETRDEHIRLVLESKATKDNVFCMKLLLDPPSSKKKGKLWGLLSK